jgi:hypothetical protein
MTRSSIPFFAMAMMVLAAFARRVLKGLNSLAPVGYEDDEGFHFDGAKPE